MKTGCEPLGGAKKWQGNSAVLVTASVDLEPSRHFSLYHWGRVRAA